MSKKQPKKEKIYKTAVCLKCSREFQSLVRAPGTWNRVCKRCHRVTKDFGAMAGRQVYEDKYEIEHLSENIL